MKLKPAEAARAVERPDPATRFFLFHGPDEAGSRALADKLLKSLGAEKFAVPSGSIKADPAALADEAGAMALFGGPRAIWIEPAGDEIADGVAALLEAASVESPVIAVAGPLKKASVLLKLAESHKAAIAAPSYVPEGRDAVRLVIEAGRAEGLRIDGDIAERIADGTGGNTAIIAQELAKYALFADAAPDRPRELTIDMVELLGAESGDSGIGTIGDLALGGEPRALADELEQGAPEAVPLVRALQRRVVQLGPLRARVERGESVDAVMASMGKALFWKDKPLMGRMLRSWSAERIAHLSERLVSLEKAVILSDAPAEAALGEELITIARAGQRRR